MKRSNQSLALGIALPLAVTGALLWVGYRHFWFLMDDAFISFRYVRNSLSGFGYVWNPPPFRAVEGYTNFSWVVLLEAVWRFLGVDPTRSANPLAFLFSFGSLAVTAFLAFHTKLKPSIQAWRPILVFLVLLGVATNETFLFSTSSGLETAMFDFLAISWLYAAVRDSSSCWRSIALCGTAGLLPLTRPEGLLFWIATLPLMALRLPIGRRTRTVSILCLGVPVVHEFWRHATYGEWLPNTYYAKHVRPWPEAGVRYLSAFVLEFGFWIPALFLLYVGFRKRRTLARIWRRNPLHPARSRFLPVLFAASPFVGIVAYYTLRIGGDQFEYRVFCVVIPFVFVATLRAASLLASRPGDALLPLGIVIAASWPLPIAHEIVARREVRLWERESVRLAPRSPWFVRPYVSAWDGLQAWLQARRICTRHEIHRQLQERLTSRLEASRNLDQMDPGTLGSNPVRADYAVGMAGWLLPRVAILDLYGLNDRVIARNPVQVMNATRQLGHDRRPPAGYVLCFRPNVLGPPLIGTPREAPLTDDDIRACEVDFAEELEQRDTTIALSPKRQIVDRDGLEPGVVVEWLSRPDLSARSTRRERLSTFQLSCDEPLTETLQPFAVRLSSWLVVDVPGRRRFRLAADDEATFRINGRVILRAETGRASERSVRFLAPGLYELGLDLLNHTLGGCADVTTVSSRKTEAPIDQNRLLAPFVPSIDPAVSALPDPLAPVVEMPERLLPGLRATEFANAKWEGRAQTSVVSSITIVRQTLAFANRTRSIRLEGYLQVPTDGLMRFEIVSDDDARLTIDDQFQVLSADPVVRSRLAAPLHKGIHRIRIDWRNVAGPALLDVEWSIGNAGPRPIPAIALFH